MRSVKYHWNFYLWSWCAYAKDRELISRERGSIRELCHIRSICHIHWFIWTRACSVLYVTNGLQRGSITLTGDWAPASIACFVFSKWYFVGCIVTSLLKGLSIIVIIIEILTYLLTYLFTYLLQGAEYLKSWLSLSLSKKYCFLYGTLKFITVFTKARHWTPSWASWIQFAPSIPVSQRSSLMLSSHLRLGLPSGLLRSVLPTKTL
jgi:hypothetical protein